MSLGVYFPPIKPYSEMLANFVPDLMDYYKYPEKYALPPFRIFGNLYYVGDKKVCCHLLDTGEGLILIDSGYAHTMHILLSNIKALGFLPENIKYIIHSHGHFDHFGCSCRLKALYGCQILMGAQDAERLRINPEAALMQLGPEPYAPIPETDILLTDGDTICLGNVNIRCISAPGHTEGVMAFFFDATCGDETKKVGYWGGMGFFTMHRPHLKEYGLPLDLPARMAQTIEKLRKEKVDITLGNHPANNGTVEKYAYMCQHTTENPFADPSVWSEMLETASDRLNDFLAKDY